MVINPLFLYMANYISSDGFFLALSLAWFGLLLWVIHRPDTRIIVAQALVLFIAFTVRYNALIYPFIAAIAFGMSRLAIRKKIMGIAAGMLLCGAFILYTGNKYKELTGIWQYSPFSGWLLANNAMFAYRYVDSAERKPVPEKFKVLDNMIRVYFDTTRDTRIHPEETVKASTFYMWDPNMSLYKYMNLKYSRDSTSDMLKKWAGMGPLYADYGRYIIRQYPVRFVRYFLLPNAQKYYAPPVEFLGMYNSGSDTVSALTKEWFGYRSQKVSPRTKNWKVAILEFYPILTGVMNVVILCGLLYFWILNGFRQKTLFRKGVLLAAVVWLVNAGATIFSCSVALRFQAFPILLTTTFALLLIDWMWRMAKNAELSSRHSPEVSAAAL